MARRDRCRLPGHSDLLQTVRRYLLPALIVLNVLLLLRLLDITPAVLPEPSDPARLARQINPEQVTVQAFRRR